MRLILLFPLVFISCLAHHSSPYYMIQSDGSRLLQYEAGGLGERNYRKEVTKPDGTVVGEYGFNDPSGRLHIVKYHTGPQGYVAMGGVGVYSGTNEDFDIMNNFKMGEDIGNMFTEDEQNLSKEDSAMEGKSETDKNENDMAKLGIAEDHHVEEHSTMDKKEEDNGQEEVKKEGEDKKEEMKQEEVKEEDKKEEMKQEEEVKEEDKKEEMKQEEEVKEEDKKEEMKQEEEVKEEDKKEEMKQEQEVKEEDKKEEMKQEQEVKEEVDEKNEFTKDDVVTEKDEVKLEDEVKTHEEIKKDDKVKPLVIDEDETTEEKNNKEETENEQKESGDTDPELAMLFPGPIVTRRRLTDKHPATEEDKAKHTGFYNYGQFYTLPEPAKFAEWYNQHSPLLTWPYQISKESPSIKGDTSADISAGKSVPFSHPWLIKQPDDSEVNTKQQSTSHITFPFYNVGFERKESTGDGNTKYVKYFSNPAFNFHEYQYPGPSVSRYIPGTQYQYPQPVPFVPTFSRNSQYGVKSLTKTSEGFLPGFDVFT